MCPSPPQIAFSSHHDYYRPPTPANSTDSMWLPETILRYECNDQYPITVPDDFFGAKCTSSGAWVGVYGKYHPSHEKPHDIKMNDKKFKEKFGKCVTGIFNF